MQPSRREFLSQATLLASAPLLPGFLTATARAADTDTRDDRVLVVLQMTGGNDGLNMVVPYEDDAYHRARPTLRVAAGQALPLADGLGLHPEMSALHDLYRDGAVGVINGVGYPNPNRSHFASMDIWHCAETNEKRRQAGWLGRVVDQRQTGDTPYALHLDSDVLPLALRTRQQAVPSIRDLNAFRLEGDRAGLRNAIALPRDGGDPLSDLQFVQRTALASCAQAERIERVADAPRQQSPYPGYGLARRLQQIATLIGAGFGARVYYTSLGGFDTHARQVLAHGPLLRELSESVGAFYRDLRQRGLARKVTLMTFSEFGRRVAENGSQGTDHGAAAPMLLIGDSVRAGLHGSAPDLRHLDEGDVPFKTDFRRVYAGVLEDWLGIDPHPVVGPGFPKLNLTTVSK